MKQWVIIDVLGDNWLTKPILKEEKTMKSFVSCVLSMFLWLSLISTAEAIPLTDSRTLYFHEHQGSSPSITLEIGGTDFETGTITYILDVTNPLNSFETFNYDTLTVLEESDFLVTAPLFSTLGISSVKVHVVETGTFTILSPIDPLPGEHDFILETDLLGTVIVPPGSIFSDWTWTNTKKQKVYGKGKVGPDGKPEEEFGWEKEITAQGTATDPSGRMYGMNFDGTGRLEQTPVPAPSALLLVGSGLAGVVGLRRKRLLK